MADIAKTISVVNKMIITEQPSEYIKSQKESFREHQRNLPFGEKMEIAFSLAERDKTIQKAVLLAKTKKIIGK